MSAHPIPRRLTPAERKRAARERLIMITRLMDSAFTIPGTNRRAGLDALLGLVPGVGDFIGGAIGLYLVMEARELGASRWLQAKMVGNLLVDMAVGAVPVAGDVFDVFFKAHQRNLKLLQKELGEPFLDDPRAARAMRDGDVIEGQAREIRDR